MIVLNVVVRDESLHFCFHLFDKFKLNIFH